MATPTTATENTVDQLPELPPVDTDTTAEFASLQISGGIRITEYRGNQTAVTVPNTIDGKTVVAMGSGVFKNRTTLTSVTLPATVTAIGSEAFRGCTALASVTLPSTLKTVSNYAFADCTALRTVTWNKGLEIIDGYINKAAEGWKTSRISKLSLCILRLAVYEMLYVSDVPAVISINEAVELSKKYDDPKAKSFINGVLNKIKVTIENTG